MRQLQKVEIEKMRKLADFLETVPPEDFDLADWVEREQRDPKSILFGLVILHPGCGFAGCAMGWAAHSGIFPGLRLTHDSDDITYAGLIGFDAIDRLFRIGENQGIFLFHRVRYQGHADPGHVARRLRRFAEIVERRINRKKPSMRIVA